MKILAIRQILVSITTLLCVLLFVKSIDDLPLYFFIVAISLLINNLWLIKLAKLKIKLECDLQFIKLLLKQSIPLLFATLFSSTIGTFGIVFLSYTTNNELTGLFSSAFKFIQLTFILAYILINSFSSQISQADSIDSKKSVAQKYSTYILIICSIVAAECFVFADVAIFITFGKQFLPAADLLKIFVFNGLFYYLSCYAAPLLRFWKYEKKVFIAYLISAIILVVVTIILTNLYGAIGTAIASVIGELSVAAILLFFLYRVLHKIFIFKLIPFLICAFIITFLSRFAIELFTDNIYYMPIAILFSAAVYLFIFVKVVFKR